MIPFAAFQEAQGPVPPRSSSSLTAGRWRASPSASRNAEDPAAVASGEDWAIAAASQNEINSGTIEHAFELPRPAALTYDKNEIITHAKRIGTFETPIVPVETAASLFAWPPCDARVPADAELVEKRIRLRRAARAGVRGAGDDRSRGLARLVAIT